MTSPKRLLLVEDDPAIRFALRDYLETAGYLVTEAASCEQAERWAARLRFIEGQNEVREVWE